MIGASGFVGSHLVPALRAAGLDAIATGREAESRLGPEATDAQMRDALDGMNAVIHLAAIAHRRAAPDQLERVNAGWPVRLYRAAAAASVEDFVFLSSIKVLGDTSTAPLRESDPYRPGDDYALSKMRAELGLREAAESAVTRLTMVRPPLVYGPGVKANFLALLRLAAWSARGLPLPLGGAQAPRSLIGVRNLCSLIRCAVGAGGVVHGADREDLTVASLLRRLGAAHLPAPAPTLVRSLLALLGRSADYPRLFLPLQVDWRSSAQRLGWMPPFGTTEQLEETVAWFRSR